MRRLALGALLAVASACSTGSPRGPMTDGERMYRSKCTSCHRVYEPSEQTPQKWAATLDKMEALKKVKLTPDERALILGYLAGGQPSAPLR